MASPVASPPLLASPLLVIQAIRCRGRRDPDAMDFEKFALIEPQTSGAVNPALAGHWVRISLMVSTDFTRS
jgi:hypothetical protein